MSVSLGCTKRQLSLSLLYSSPAAAVETNEDQSNENKQVLFIQSLLPSLVFGSLMFSSMSFMLSGFMLVTSIHLEVSLYVV